MAKITLSSPQANIPEGTSGTTTVTVVATVDVIPTSNITIILSNRQIITIPAGQTSGSIEIPLNVPVNTDDNYTDANIPIETINIMTAVGGGIGTIDTTNSGITFNVVDDGDVTHVDMNVITNETSGEATATIQTSNPPDSSVFDFKTTFPTVTVNINGVDYTVQLNEKGVGNITFSIADDVTMKITDVDGNFEAVQLNSDTIWHYDATAITTNDNITTNEDTSYTLNISDFGDTQKHVAQIKITTLPENGKLYLNGVEVTVGTIFSVEDVKAGLVTFVPNYNTDIDGNFKFEVGNMSGRFSDTEYSTTIEVVAVADAPTLEANLTKVIDETKSFDVLSPLDVLKGGDVSLLTPKDVLSGELETKLVAQTVKSSTGENLTTSDVTFTGTNDVNKVYNSVTKNITTASGNDTLEFGVISGRTIVTANGDDKVIINSDSISNKIDLGAGKNTLTVGSTLSGGTVTAQDGADTLIVNTHIVCNTNVDLGNGDNTISVGGNIDHSNIVTGDGADKLIVGTHLVNYANINLGDGDNKVSVKGDINLSSVTTGNGADTIVVGNNFVGSAVINSGDGADTISIDGYTSASKINAGNGDDTVIIGENALCNTIIDAGEGDNTVSIALDLSNSDILGGAGADIAIIGRNAVCSSIINLGDGENIISIANDSTSTKITTGVDDDSLIIGRNAACNTINLGEGNNTAQINGVLSSGTLTTLGGDDTVIANSITCSENINLGEGDNTLSVTKDASSLKFTSLSGTDTVIIGEDATCSTTIDVGSGDDVVSIEGKLYSSSKVLAGDGNDTIITGGDVACCSTIDAGNGDDIVSVAGNLSSATIIAGLGADRLVVDGDSVCSTIDTGSGNDLVYLNGDIKSTKINLGDGDDIIRLSSDKAVDFDCCSLIDGGKGFDSLHFTGSMDQYQVMKGCTVITWEQFFLENAAGDTGVVYTIQDKTDLCSKIEVKNIENVIFNSQAQVDHNYSYEITLKAGLTDTDGSETLSNITLKNLPAGVVVKDTNGNIIEANEDGTYTVKIDENGEAKIILSSTDTISHDDLRDISASVTSTEKSNGDFATTTIYGISLLADDPTLQAIVTDVTKDSNSIDELKQLKVLEGNLNVLNSNSVSDVATDTKLEAPKDISSAIESIPLIGGLFGLFSKGENLTLSDAVFTGNNDVEKVYSTVTKNVTTDAGNDELVFSTTLNGRTIKTASGNDTVVMTSASISNNVDLGEGNNKTTVGTYISGGSIVAGAGNDTVIVNTDVICNSNINLGNGDNTISIGGNSDRATITTGNGDDHLIIGTHIVNLSNINLGDGNNRISVKGDINNSSITTGNGADTLIVGSDIVCSTNIDLGAGKDNINVNGFTSASTINLGAGADTLNIDAYTSSTKINAGNGADIINIGENALCNTIIDAGEGDNTVSIALDLSDSDILGGAGADIAIIGRNAVCSSIINLGDGENIISIANDSTSTKITTGVDDDSLIIGRNAACNTINLGEGNNTAQINGVLSSGTLTTLGGMDTIIANSVSCETVNLGANDDIMSVTNNAGTLKLNAQDGDDRLVVGGNITCSTIDMGNGNDFVSLNADVKSTDILLGDGNDAVRLSSSSTTEFDICSLIDGGTGYDSIYFTGSMDQYKVMKGCDTITWDQFFAQNAAGDNGVVYTIQDTTDCCSKIEVKNIENIGFEADDQYSYGISLKAGLTDTDGSGETLSDVTLKDIPAGTVVKDLDGNIIGADNYGNYNIKLDENGEAKITLNSSHEISQDNLENITASVTSTQESNGDSVTTSVSMIDFSNLTKAVDGDLDLSSNGKDDKLENLTLDKLLFMADGHNEITISGDKNDSISFKNEEGKAWEKSTSTVSDNGKTYDVYTNSADDHLQVKVEQHISDGITC